MKKALQLAISVAKPASRAPPVTAVVAAHRHQIGAVMCPDDADTGFSNASSKIVTLTPPASSSSSWSTFTRPSWTAASVSVGRWHRPASASNPPPQFSPGATLWGTSTTASSSSTPTKLDPSLPNPHLTDLVIGFGDGTAAHGHDTSSSTTAFPRALDAAFPGVRNMIGIVAGPTPFVTGKPFTLFADDGEVKESGFVGAALVRGTSKSGSDSEQKSVPITCKLTFTGLAPLGGVQLVTRAQGNVILDVSGVGQGSPSDVAASPAALLIKSLGKNLNAPGAKERRVYAGLSLQPGEQPFLLTDITAGDPSRGFLALATHLAVQPGWAIQFFESQSSEAVKPPVIVLNGVEVECPHGFTAWSSEVGRSVLHGRHARLTIEVEGWRSRRRLWSSSTLFHLSDM
ncbi:hypothetical protein BCR44DRAFT_1056814 [Catenaria anguillulae PL171]|uniref:FIST domain-containing protein n=1 Tax=Catenaria anguillulae PL171 TaxID=765915 RepID=A0A1Y2H4Y5_9FUNG|nr:hypothetical protein BCR44DRAFT_1056814 [Catenaria anguillulae PL171]